MEETSAQPKEPETEPLIEWVAHPAKQRPTAATLVALFIAVIAVGIYFWTFSVIFTVLAILILVGSLSGFYFPTRYRFFDDTIVVNYLISSIKKEWSQFRSFYPDKNGLLLSPFPLPTRLENFRGLYLRIGNADRERIIEFVKSKIKKDGDGS